MLPLPISSSSMPIKLALHRTFGYRSPSSPFSPPSHPPPPPASMAARVFASLLLCMAFLGLAMAGNPYRFFTWNVTYGNRSPLGKPQRVILINDQFPGPNINSTTNDNIVVNVFNNLDHPLLFSWNGIQQRKNCWQDGMPGTNCPILPGTNYTYHFQVKDQIGSYFYFPSIGLQKANGGVGGLRVNSRLLIPVPFADPEDDYTVLIGDWYGKTHAQLQKRLDGSRGLGRPAGVIINGQSGKKDVDLFTMKAGKTYRYRICNTGIKTSLNFRFQDHPMKLVEMDGSHVMQSDYDSLDIHVGQCYSVLVTANKKPGAYYMVASSRFTRYHLSATGVVRYVGTKSAPSPKLPKSPKGWMWSLNQFRSFQWNLTASAARPNPQGSYHYGSINITRTIKLRNTVETVDGKLRFALNGKSFRNAPFPLKLAEYYGIANQAFKYDTIGDKAPRRHRPVTIEPIVLNMTYRDFVEIVLENPERSFQSYHLNGYSFFPVGMGSGKWTREKRKTYNLLDAVSRHTIQVYPRSWTAILLTFDNAGMWNLRSEILERAYLGQQLYFSVVSSARSLRDEYTLPESQLLCGPVTKLPRPPPYT